MSVGSVYTITPVTDKKGERAFLEMPSVIYKGDPLYVRPLDPDITSVFDPSKNVKFAHGDCIRWVLYKAGRPVGRIAAFYDTVLSDKEKQPTGGCGFFECINDREAAKLLFDTARHWLAEKGFEAMDGPINFGDRSKWWGLLADGFLQPTYGMNYNPPYYKDLFEAYGFKLYFKQYVFHRDMLKPPSERVRQKASYTLNNPDYSFRHFKRKDSIRFVKDFKTIYNNTWTRFLEAPAISDTEAFQLFKSLKPVLVEELLWFGYYKNEPVAFFVMIPDLNIIIKDFNGRLHVWNKIRLLLRLRRGVKRVIGLIFGVDPEHHSKGVDQGLMVTSGDAIQQRQFYTDIEMNWIGDFNPRMVNMTRNIESRLLKTYITYRLLFDPDKPFERHPIV